MKLFRYVELETISTCNRVCPTCIRNSNPDREALKSWFEENRMGLDIVMKVMTQIRKLGFRGNVCLSHYNEPLYDDRLYFIGDMVRAVGLQCYFHSNGDLLTEKMAGKLDGHVNTIIFSLYMNEPVKSKRKEWIQSLFKKTTTIFTTGKHIPTHFSPEFDTNSLIEKHKNRPCGSEPTVRLVINHRRQYLLCCEDMIGSFDLGYFPDKSIEEYWFGEQHTKIVEDLSKSKGRLNYDYCSICPKS